MLLGWIPNIRSRINKPGLLDYEDRPCDRLDLGDLSRIEYTVGDPTVCSAHVEGEDQLAG